MTVLGFIILAAIAVVVLVGLGGGVAAAFLLDDIRRRVRKVEIVLGLHNQQQERCSDRSNPFE
jgi:hypothetical protein